MDLDFSVCGTLPDNTSEIREILNTALKAIRARTNVKARCQSINPKPPGDSKTFRTYSIKVCFQLPGDRYYQNFDEDRPISQVIELEISFNDVVCETMFWVPHSEASPLRSCSLEDIIAEKLRALLQQVTRDRNRPQDVFDIASRVREHGADLDLTKISKFLEQKSNSRGISPRKSAYDDDVRSRASVGYATELKAQFGHVIIPFDEAWGELTAFVQKLDIPD